MKEDVIKLAMLGADHLLDAVKELGQDESTEQMARCATAIKSLCAIFTPRDRPAEPGDWLLIERTSDHPHHWRGVRVAADSFYITDRKLFGDWYGPLPMAPASMPRDPR